MTNYNSSDQATFFYWSMVQSQCSQHRHSWRWWLVSRGTWVCHLLHSCITVSRTVCSNTFLLDSALYWAIRCATAWLRLQQAGQSPTNFFFDNVWTSSTMSPTAGFIAIHLLCISTHTTVDHKQPMSHAVLETLVPSLLAITIWPLLKSLKSAVFSITHKSKQTNSSSDSSAPVKYLSPLTMYFPRHPDKFIVKCRGGHVLAQVYNLYSFYKKLD